MKKGTKNQPEFSQSKKQLSRIEIICWCIIPCIIILLLILEGFGLYSFTNERLIIIGACVIVILLPFFSEITIKNISLKKDN